MDVNQANVLTSHDSSSRPRFLGPEDPLPGLDVFGAPDETTEPLPIGPSEVVQVPAEHWMNAGQNTTRTRGPIRRASSKPAPPRPPPILATRPMPKSSPASRRSMQQIIDEAVERVMRLPRRMWMEEIAA